MMQRVGVDLVGRWVLYFFASCLGGALLGLAVAWLATFEIGAGLGFLLPGLVSLSFTVAFCREYRDLSFNPRRTAGTVVGIEDRASNASGSVTTPVAIVEYTAADGSKRRGSSLGGTSLHTGDSVVVVPRSGMPDGIAVGTPHEMQGGAIVSMLFGTFPLSAGIFFVVSALAGAVRAEDVSERWAIDRRSYLTTMANLTIFCGILAIPFFSEPEAHGIMMGFAVVALGLWLHVVQGVRLGADARWTTGLGVLAVNFSAWVVALWFLTDPNAGW